MFSLQLPPMSAITFSQDKTRWPVQSLSIKMFRIIKILLQKQVVVNLNIYSRPFDLNQCVYIFIKHSIICIQILTSFQENSSKPTTTYGTPIRRDGALIKLTSSGSPLAPSRVDICHVRYLDLVEDCVGGVWYMQCYVEETRKPRWYLDVNKIVDIYTRAPVIVNQM